MNLEQYTDDLLKSILNIINKDKEYVIGKTEYRGKAILIEDMEGTRFWLRISVNKDNKLIVDLSTIELRDSLQRKGLFSKICKMIQDKKYIEKAYISNVCTEKMLNFCKKHKLKFMELLNAYKVK